MNMCLMTGFDVYYGLTSPTIEQHCCRKIGCIGGITLDEACELVAQWHEEQAELWRSQEHPDCQYFV